MSNRTLFVLFSVFLVMILAAAWPRIQVYMQETQAPKGFKFSDFTEESIGRITVTSAGKEVILKKNNDSWQAGDFVAAEKTIKSFFNALGKLQAGELAAVKPESHVRLGVNEEKGTILALQRIDNGQEDVFIFGQPITAVSDEFYVRRVGSNEVYFVRGSISTYLSNDINGWRDKTVLTVAPEKVAIIEVVEEAGTTILTKKEKGWEVDSHGRVGLVTATQANELNAIFNSLVATDFLDEQQLLKYRAGKPGIIRLLAIDGTSLAELSVLVQEDDKVWVKSGNSDVVFELDEHSLGGLTNPTAFLEESKGNNQND